MQHKVFVIFFVAYPTIHKSPLVKLDVVQNFSLLYTIQGSNASLTPFLLMGHLDVVPESPGEWDAKPFSGDVVGDFIYGRGALDMKQSVFVSIQWHISVVVQYGILYWYRQFR